MIRLCCAEDVHANSIKETQVLIPPRVSPDEKSIELGDNYLDIEAVGRSREGSNGG